MRNAMLDAFPGKLVEHIRPDYLFITGDLRFAKVCKGEYPAAIETNVKKLMTAFEIPPERTHIVMGNHDVLHAHSRKDIAPLLLEGYYKNGRLNSEQLTTLQLSQQKFYKLYKDVCGRDAPLYHYFSDEGSFNIIGLNTAFACSDTGEDGRLIVGMGMVQKTLEGIDSSKPAIVLAHHGFVSLSLSEQDKLEHKLKNSGALLYLCGHEHMADCRIIAKRQENVLLHEYICGTGMDKLPNGNPADMVVFLGELDTEKKSGCVRAYKWSERSEAWLSYQDISYKQSLTEDGVHYFPVPPAGKRVTKANKANALEKYRNYLLYECGEIRLDGMPADDKVGSKSLALEKLYIPAMIESTSRFYRNTHEVTWDTNRVEVRAGYAHANGPLTFDFFHELLVELEEAILMTNELEIIWLRGLLGVDDEIGYYRYQRRKGVTPRLLGRLDKYSNTLTEHEKSVVNDRIDALANRLADFYSLIPSADLGFRRVVLAGPGGGKTTLLKRLVTGYAFPERRDDPEIKDNLPNRELFPIWIRCRDLKERASFSITEIIQGIPARAEFPGDQPELASALMAEIFARIEAGEALILFDGLDEIAEAGLRKDFADKIARFAELNPKANIIVTSRNAGFEHVSGGKLGAFLQLKIAPLSDTAIKHFCRRWHTVIINDREETLQSSDELVETILKNKKILSLARSPLLLTTLLLVERRVRRLPDNRAELYEESIKVLLETWNQEGFERIDLEPAKCQLSYIAFEMMREGIQVIGRKNLETLLKDVREEHTWLPSNLETPGAFLERVELRSSLLTKRGYRLDDDGVLEEIYEFQHLTFQEYLAAYAAVSGNCKDSNHYENDIDVLEGFYRDEGKVEVILLAASHRQAKSRDVTRMVNSIINQINALDRKEDTADDLISLRNLLAMIFLDGFKLNDEARSKILTTVTTAPLWSSQVPFLKRMLASSSSALIREILINTDQTSTLRAFDLLDNSLDAFSECIKAIMNADKGSPERLEGLKTLTDMCWAAGYYDINASDLEEMLVPILLGVLMTDGEDDESCQSAVCLSMMSIGDMDQYNMPSDIVWRVITLCYKKRETDALKFIDQLIRNTNDVTRYRCPQGSPEIIEFMVESLADAIYDDKYGIYLAAVFAGAWTRSEAERILLETFANSDLRDHIVDRLTDLLNATT